MKDAICLLVSLVLFALSLVWFMSGAFKLLEVIFYG